MAGIGENPHHPVGPVGLDRVHVRGGDQFGHFWPGGPDEAAFPAGILVPGRAGGVAGDLRPRDDRITQPAPGLPPHL
jgi:hypothetical protein